MFNDFRREDDIEALIPCDAFVHCAEANVETELISASLRRNRRIQTGALPPKEKLRDVDPKPVAASDVEHPSTCWSVNLDKHVGNRFDAS
jgi:hypothetical protein